MLMLVAENSTERRKAKEKVKSHLKAELAATVLCGEK